jgi:hypothetical protein
LRELWLFNNDIGDVGAIAIGAAIMQNSTLIAVGFDGNPASQSAHLGIEAALNRSQREITGRPHPINADADLSVVGPSRLLNAFAQ